MFTEEGTPLAILRRPQVQARTGLSRSTIYKRMHDGTFPPAVPLGGRIVGWRVADIEQFLKDPAHYRSRVMTRNDRVGA